MRSSIIFLIAGILIFTGCKKSQEHYTVPDWFKRWTVFNKNSYWIYWNEVTGLQDSIFVPDNPDVWGYTEYSTDPIKDRITVDYKGGVLTRFTIYAESKDFADLEVTDNYSGTQALSTSLIAVPQFYSGNGHTYGVVEVFKTLLINDVQYSNVYHSRYSFIAASDDSVVKDYYFVEYKGLVKYSKRVGTVDTTWSLLRCQVFQ